MPQDRIQPDEWVSEISPQLSTWVHSNFHEQKYRKGFLSIQQRVVRDLLHPMSPYRGLLFYHGLGTGKTRAAIASTEAFFTMRKKIIVLLPASLQSVWKNEIMAFSRHTLFQRIQWFRVVLEANEERTSRVLNVLKDLFEIDKKHLAPYFDSAAQRYALHLPVLKSILKAYQVQQSDKLDNVSGVLYKDLSEADRTHVQEIIRLFLNHKYQFISYNGLTRSNIDAFGPKHFDNAFIIIEEAHNFMAQASHRQTLKYILYHRLLTARNTKFILLSGTPMINHPFELSYFLNLLRGPIHTLHLTLCKNKSVPTKQDLENVFERHIVQGIPLMRYIEQIRVDEGNRSMALELVPYGFAKSTDETYIPLLSKKQWVFSEDGFYEHISNICVKEFGFKNVRSMRTSTALPLDKTEFMKTFFDESDPMNPKLKEHDLFQRRINGLVSYFKSNVQDLLTEVRPIRVPMSEHQFKEYAFKRNQERKMDQFRKGRDSLFSKKSSVYRAYSRMICNFCFPTHVKRIFPSDIRRAIREMDAGNAMDDDEFEPVTQQEKEAFETLQAAPATNTKNNQTQIQKEYEKNQVDVLKELERSGAMYLSMEHLGSYSPKMKQAFMDMNECPGKSLFYSMFRKMEGVAIMSLVLQQNGWILFDIDRIGDTWTIKNVDEVMHPRYDHKRFTIFSEDRHKSDILNKLMNGELDHPNVPTELRDVLRSKKYRSKADNLYGKYIRNMMITQSASEGVSFHEIRRVLLLEPFWNQVRIDQVIGRATRGSISHQHLPEKDRNVQAFIYISTFTPEQRTRDFSIKTLDLFKTSDEHIYDLAYRKTMVGNEVLNLMKEIAIDCRIHAKKNKLEETNLKCYAPPENMKVNDAIYIPSILEDLKHAQTMEPLIRHEKRQGRVVQDKHGNKYIVLNDNLATLYDYDAYRYARVLTPVNPNPIRFNTR